MAKLDLALKTKIEFKTITNEELQVAISMAVGLIHDLSGKYGLGSAQKLMENHLESLLAVQLFRATDIEVSLEKEAPADEMIGGLSAKTFNELKGLLDDGI